MFHLLVLASLVAVTDDIDLAALKSRDVVQLVLRDDSSLVGGVVTVTADAVEVVNLENQSARSYSPAELSWGRSGLSERQVVDKVGAGSYAA